MSEILKCRCGSDDIAIKVFGDDVQEMRAECNTCGRASVWRTTDEATITFWNADRLAEEKAREALRPFAEMAPSLRGSGAALLGNGKVCTMHDKYMNDGRGGERCVRVSDFTNAEDALRLLEER